MINSQHCCRCALNAFGDCVMGPGDCNCAAGTSLPGYVAVRCHVGSARFDESMCFYAARSLLSECPSPPVEPPENWLERVGADCTWQNIHAPWDEPLRIGHCCSGGWPGGGESYGYGSGGGPGGIFCLETEIQSFAGFLPIAVFPRGLSLIQPPEGTRFFACYSQYRECGPDDLTPGGNPGQSQIPMVGGCNSDLSRRCGHWVLNRFTDEWVQVVFGYEEFLFYFAFYSVKPDCDGLPADWTVLDFGFRVTYLYYRDPDSNLLTLCRSQIAMNPFYEELEFRFYEAGG